MDTEPLDDFDTGILELKRTYDAAAALPRRDRILTRDWRYPNQEIPNAE